MEKKLDNTSKDKLECGDLYIKHCITCPYNVDPLTRNFYIGKLGCTWVYIFSEAVQICTHNLRFEQKKVEKYNKKSKNNYFIQPFKITVY